MGLKRKCQLKDDTIFSILFMPFVVAGVVPKTEPVIYAGLNFVDKLCILLL